MDNALRTALKNIRSATGMSARDAGRRAGVSGRTWSSWETLGSDDSQTKRLRPASKKALWNFFLRSKIPVPPAFIPYLKNKPYGRVVSITSYKGGVGKSPITLNVAACLSSQGLKVAIVTNDEVFRTSVESEETPAPGTLASRIDFFDVRDLIISKSDVTKLNRYINEQVIKCPAAERDLRAFVYAEDIEELKRKQQATNTLKELIKRYDFVFFDLNRNVDIIRRFADMVVVILDSNCPMSIDGGRSVIARMKRLKSGKSCPPCFGLITNLDIGGRNRELEEYAGEKLAFTDELVDAFHRARCFHNRRREAILKDIHALNIPILGTHMTTAYKEPIELFEHDKDIMDGYGFFDAIHDFAPLSHSAYETTLLANEILACCL